MSSSHLAAALVVPFEQLRMSDVEAVGGKNASLGEMISQLARAGVRVPGGFATTANAFRQFLDHAGLTERIDQRLTSLEVDDVNALAVAGAEIRGWVMQAPLPQALEAAVRSAYAELAAGDDQASFAVRSSATADPRPARPCTACSSIDRCERGIWAEGRAVGTRSILRTSAL